MSKVKTGGVQYNLLYDPTAIEATVEYLKIHNPNVKVKFDDIENEIFKNAEKNAKWATKDRSEHGKWAMSYTGTAGYVLLYSLIEYTKNTGYPIIQADVYVAPNIRNYGTTETKFRN